MLANSVKFSRGTNADFIRTLRKRVVNYFDDNNISQHGNWTMVVKSIVMLTLLFAPWVIMVAGNISNPWIVILLYAIMAFGKSGVGFSVMHDACHGSYSKYPWVNKALSYTMNFLGGNARNWKIQHNVLHHSFTNVEGMDEDIAPPEWLLRFSPHAKRYWIHRAQHVYGWLLYSLETLMWCTTKDFVGLAKYKKEGLLRKEDGKFGVLMTKTALWKAVYFGYILVLPIIFTDVKWWVVLIGFFVMHLITGLLIALVFQAAHVMPDMEYPLPDDEGNLENNWAVHQILTTTNFAPKSKVFGWFIGGLNFQIEHHLFPNVCHIHYKKISKIVKDTAAEYGLPYRSKRYFLGAIADHARMLKLLGQGDVIPVHARA